MEEEFVLRGKCIRMARLLKGKSVTELSELTNIEKNHLAIIEREERPISPRNYYRILRALRRDLKVSDEILTSITLIVEFDENKEEVLKNG